MDFGDMGPQMVIPTIETEEPLVEVISKLSRYIPLLAPVVRK